jgi:hypothetical protein
MEIKIQLEKNLMIDDVIKTPVSEELSSDIIGEIISYDDITGIAICELYNKKENQF